MLGCLVEKQRTTPEQYPLTLNSLRLACNQSTNRDPVVDYDEATVRDAAQRLGRRGLARFASGHGGRAAKYRHMLKAALELAEDELALLGVLMLRGAQTPGELRARAERMHRFEDATAVDSALERLVGRDLVARLERRPGQKELRYAHLLGAETDEEPGAQPATRPAPAPPPREPDQSLESRVTRLEDEVRDLRASLEGLRGELGA